MAEIRNMNPDEGENENSHDVRGLHCLTEAWAKKSEFLQNEISIQQITERGISMYRWPGMKKLSWIEVQEIHRNEGLAGYFKLYDDGSEGLIELDYDWKDIVHHYETGGEFGIELKI